MNTFRPMRLALIVALVWWLIILIGFSLAHAAEHVIRNDTGGYVARQQDFRRWEILGDTVRVDGLCASACTQVLAQKNVCATARAVFKFHQASKWRGGPRADRDTEFMMWRFAKERPALAAWIKAHGGLTRRLITLQGDEMLRIVPRCP